MRGVIDFFVGVLVLSLAGDLRLLVDGELGARAIASDVSPLEAFAGIAMGRPYGPESVPSDPDLKSSSCHIP